MYRSRFKQAARIASQSDIMAYGDRFRVSFLSTLITHPVYTLKRNRRAINHSLRRVAAALQKRDRGPFFVTPLETDGRTFVLIRDINLTDIRSWRYRG